jgi:hypothetical protein
MLIFSTFGNVVDVRELARPKTWGAHLDQNFNALAFNGLVTPLFQSQCSYVTRGKSDAIDAEAICEAVMRPIMQFVAIKTVEQQSLLSTHRARSLLVRQRTQLINSLRGMIAEFDVHIPTVLLGSSGL